MIILMRISQNRAFINSNIKYQQLDFHGNRSNHDLLLFLTFISAFSLE